MPNFSNKFIHTHLIWLSILICSIIYLISSLHIVSDITQFMPSNHNDKNVQLLLDELQKGNTAKLLILRVNGVNTQKIASISKELKSKLNKSSLFNLVHNGQQPINANDFITGQYKILYDYRYLLSANSSLSTQDLSFSLNKRLSELRAGVNIFKDSLASDPQNHFFSYLTKILQRGQATKHHGIWFDKQKKSALLLIELSLEKFDLDKQQLAIDKINTLFERIKTNNIDESLSLDITGAASMAVKTRTAIQSTSKWLSSIALILMSFLFWWAYRSFYLFFIALLPIGSAVIMALTVTNIFFQQVHGIIIAFGITLLGVCIDYPVHLFSHHQPASDPHKTVRSIWPTLRLGVITTAIAYLAMLGTGFTGLSQLTVFAITGLFVSLFVTRWVVPFWLKNNLKITIPAYIDYLTSLKIKTKYKGYTAIIISLFCFITISTQFNSIWSKNISDLSPIPEQTKILDQELRSSIGAPDINHVFLLKNKDAELLLQQTEEFTKELYPLLNNNLVERIYSVTDFIPSQKTQLSNQTLLPDKQQIQSNLKGALKSLPFKHDFFSPFIQDINKNKNLELLSLNKIFATPLAQYIKQDLFYRNNEWVSIIRLAGVKNERAFFNWLENNEHIESYYLNLRQASSSLMADYQQTALYRLLLGSFFISLIIFLIRPALRASIILMPVIFAVLLSISIQLMLGTQLSLFHVLALLLIFGIGLDYSLFFDRTCFSSNEQQHRLHGIFISAISTIITFGILGFSDIPVLSALGQTVTLGVLACFVLTLLFNLNSSKINHIT